jgi:hypothetical protein
MNEFRRSASLANEMDYTQHDFGVGYVSNKGQEDDAAAKAKAIYFVNVKLATVDALPMVDFHEFEDGK